MLGWKAVSCASQLCPGGCVGGGASLELILPLGMEKQVLKLEAPDGTQGSGPL